MSAMKFVINKRSSNLGLNDSTRISTGSGCNKNLMNSMLLFIFQYNNYNVALFMCC